MDEEEDKGLFVVFEGIDGSGEDTQLEILYRLIKKWDKYQDILATHEPWKDKEIKKRLQQDKDAYSDAEEMALLYIGDRTEHTYVRIRPLLSGGGIVLCSRYKMSTCAYQQVQGMSLDRLLKLHEHRGIIIPDVTFFLDVSGDVAEERRKKRGAPQEKFEVREFMDKVIEKYRELAELSKKNPKLFGRVIRIDGDPKPEIVANNIEKAFAPIYDRWKGIFHYSELVRK